MQEQQKKHNDQGYIRILPGKDCEVRFLKGIWMFKEL